METITWSISISVAGGFKFVQTDKSDVEAYDKIKVALAPTEHADVQLQPGVAAQVRLLAIISNIYDHQLTYQPRGAAAPVALDAPILLMGDAGTTLFGDTQLVTFTNNTADAIEIQILVGRDATA